VREIKLPSPHPGQLRAIREAKRFTVLECGRRFGKTKLGERLAAKAAMSGAPVGWFGPNYKYVLEPWDSLCRILAPAATSISKQEHRLSLMTGGTIDFWTMDNPDCGRGRKYKRAIIDEAGIVTNLKDAWEAAIRPTLTDLRGDAWFLGTPRGHGYFHQLFARGEQGHEDWTSLRLATTDNPLMDAAEVAAAERDLPPSVFRQEYLGIPSDDGGNPFGLSAIRQCVRDAGCDGAASVYGVDLAKSQDWTVLCGLSEGGEVCKLERWQSDWGTTRRRLIQTIGDTPALVDSTGVGDPIVEDLQRALPNVEGYTFTSRSKQQIMEGLASAIHQTATRFPSGWLVSELEAFCYEYSKSGVRYSAPEGMHDDGVCALALAVHHLPRARRFVARVIGINETTSHLDDDGPGWTYLD
jgi:hypothetical protein